MDRGRPRRGNPLAVTLALVLALAAPVGAVRAGAEAAGPDAAAATTDAAAAPVLGPVTSLPLPRFVSLRAETANARRGPGLSHRVDWEFVRPGLPLEVTAEYGHWRRVRDAEGAGGWVHHSLLSGVRTVVVQGEALAPLLAAASPTAAIRAWLEPGVVARLDRCEGAFCRVIAGGADGWTPRAGLWGVDRDGG